MLWQYYSCERHLTLKDFYICHLIQLKHEIHFRVTDQDHSHDRPGL